MWTHVLLFQHLIHVHMQEHICICMPHVFVNICITIDESYKCIIFTVRS